MKKDFVKNIQEEVVVEMKRSQKLQDVYLPGIIDMLYERRNYLFSELYNIYECEPIFEEQNYITIFPNPSEDEICIKVDLLEFKENLSLKIISMKGDIIYKGIIENKNDKTFFSFLNYPRGLYNILLQDEKGTINLKTKLSIN